MNTARILKFAQPTVPANEVSGSEVKRMDGGFIQIPNDVFRAANRCLKGSQKGMFFAVVEKTLGYNKTRDDVTISQLAECAGIERQNGSPAFHALVAKNVISAGAGKYGFVVEINPVSVWKLTEKERLKLRRTSENQTHENQTNVLNSDVGASEIQTHKIQLPKDKYIFVDAAHDADQIHVAENHPFVAANAATAAATADNHSGSLPEAADKKTNPAMVNRKRFEAIVGKFNEIFADCPGVRKVNLAAKSTNGKRLKLVPAAWAIAKQRIADWVDAEGLIDGEAPNGKHCVEWFGLYFASCREDGFITGASGRGKGHEHWKPGFEYMLRPEVMEARVFEGA